MNRSLGQDIQLQGTLLRVHRHSEASQRCATASSEER